MAPDDEILAEMFALQSELLQQMAINRSHAAPLLLAALEDIPRQLEAASQRRHGVDVAKAWATVRLCCMRPPQILIQDLQEV